MEGSIQVRFEAFANEGWGKAWQECVLKGTSCSQICIIYRLSFLLVLQG